MQSFDFMITKDFLSKSEARANQLIIISFCACVYRTWSSYDIVSFIFQALGPAFVAIMQGSVAHASKNQVKKSN